MQQFLPYFQGIVIPVLVTLVSVFVLRPFAKRLGLLDYPGGRKKHPQETPLIGGIAIFLGVCVGLVFLPIQSGLYIGVFIGSCILIIVGAMDDFFEISPRARLFAQISSVLCIILIDRLSVNYIGGLFFYQDAHLNALSIPVTLFLGVAFINAINMLDGQDGLAASIIFTEVLLLFCISIYLKEIELSLLLITFLSLIVIFLCFNGPLPWRNSASIFLGDSGSNFLAFFVVWCVIYFSQFESSLIKPMTLVWIVALPFFDLGRVCLKRIQQGRSCFTPGHDHIHHILQDHKISTFLSTLYLSVLSLGFGIMGIILAWLRVFEGIQLILFLGIFFLYISIVKLLNTNVVFQTQKEDIFHTKTVV